MSSRNPELWRAPVWHPDFGDSLSELRALQEFCLALLGRFPEYLVDLDCVEEGYMLVNIGLEKLGKIAELHIVSSDEFVYGLFRRSDDEEFYFNKICSGLELFEDGVVLGGTERSIN